MNLKKAISVLLIGLFSLLMFSFVRCKVYVYASPSVIHVPTSDILTIQQGVDIASSGDTILVASGTYHENLTITKSVFLVGENRTRTIIDGDGASNVISINSDNVTIESLTITKSVQRFNDVGIRVSRRTGIIINDTEITNTSTGIALEFSSGGSFSGNIIANNTYAVNFLYSNNNVFSKNNVSDDLEGAILQFSNDNVFFGNTFSGNFEDVFLSESNANLFHHNNFLDAIQVQNPSTNIWSRNGEGNYWAYYNFSGKDTNGDGIGNQPYYIDENNQDDNPLIGAFSEYDVLFKDEEFPITIISNSTITDFRFEIGRETGNEVLSFNTAGEDGTLGFCRMTIPKPLMAYPLMVLDREGSINASSLSASNETITYLYFTYPHGDQSITVIYSEALHLQSELLNEYGKLQTDFNSLNATYQALLTSFNASLQAEIDNMNFKYEALLNSFDLLLQNISQLQSSYLALNSSLQSSLADQSQSVQNVHNLTYIFGAITAAFLITTVYLSTRASGNRKPKARAAEEER